MKSFLLTAFFALGGLGLAFSLALKYLPDMTYSGLKKLFEKFPKVKQFVHDHVVELEAFEDAELQAVKKAEEEA